ncbi:cell division topological specificity factor MinE [Cyanobacterium aponinum AL20118]|uniref:Cell division topological specificity factor n=3 Tax=Cyanobacterium aponinum TaxID=379064 RepID=K9Z9I3_CYAAP|nr:cell division topological specificity factor MinE [Cyanobacterium aponinum]AFZ55387.1 cell division topological specificity factor MinE [Cyanobacterium aponinum PCC 10605]MTF40687.1 cell division topological specificity factor MinE [Cyanobacterium aponinum 0216]PHV62830.1 cell division topological specificity factor MinE [Cyanobacterium aponinum IPPAS B-1201]WPF88556.1 cell division topological specificity factor MinE [Cyanobacterium aponinum AL20115]WRL39749.1 cell division topological spe
MFKEIVDTINSWTGSNKTRNQAKSRLQLVLSHDRAGINPEIITKMRQEILEVVSRYLDIDVEETEFFIQSNDRKTSLSANLPIKTFKRTQSPLNEDDIN